MFENGFPKYILKQADKILELINENAAGVFLPPFATTTIRSTNYTCSQTVKKSDSLTEFI